MNELATLIPPPDTTEIGMGVSDIVGRAQAFVVHDDASYAIAGQHIARLKKAEKTVDKMFEEPTAKLHAAHRAMTSMRNERKEPFTQARELYNQKATTWRRQEQERARLEQEAANRKAAEERAEQERIARELREANKVEAAEAYEAATPKPIAPIVQPTVPKVRGIAVRTGWAWEETADIDYKKIPSPYLMLNTKLIDWTVRHLGQQAEQQIPGIRVFEKQTTVPTGR